MTSPTATTTGARSSGARRPWVFVTVLVLVVLVGAYLTAARRTEGPPLDPRSTTADGTKGLVTLLGRYGDVEVTDRVPGPAVDTALVLVDRYDREAASRLDDWVRAGGVLVVADPGSGFGVPLTGGATGTVEGTCDLPALASISRLDVGMTRRLQAGPGMASCMNGPDGAIVVSRSVGAGTVVHLGGPDLFTNDLVDEADNAVLAVSLLAPTPDARIAFLQPVLVGTGERGLVDLVGDPVRAALAQLLVAFAVVVLWRARRLGRPVLESQPVAVEASELTEALGRLLGRNNHPDRAAAHLRDRARRTLSAPLGLPLDATVDLVVETLTAATSLSRPDVVRAVASPVTTDADLVDVARLLTRIRTEINDDRSVRT